MFLLITVFFGLAESDEVTDFVSLILSVWLGS